METNSLLKYAIANSCDCVDEKDGMTIYELKPSVIKKDEENKIQVLTIGSDNDKGIKSILLLGETGTGKTRLINSLINHIFNVKFEYPFRLQLKDQLVGEARRQTQSQTDYITAYLIYHQHGMPHESNYMIIDTPGLSDTRGQHHQNMSMDHLRLFLLEDFGIDHLNCIGVVIKAHENRELKTQREVLSDIISLLGNDVSAITQLMATFATDETIVDVVAKDAGIQFASVYRFDNWPLYVPYKVKETFSQRQHEILKFRWQNMSAVCDEFLEAMKHAPAISLKKTRELVRERQILDGTLKMLHAGVESADNIIKTLNKRKKDQQQYTELASKIIWKQTVSKVLRETYKIMKGYHVHNCKICDQTCIFPCENPSKIPNGLVGAVAGAAVAGAAAGAVAGPPGAVAGAIVGGASVGTGTYVLTTKVCKYSAKGVMCGEDGCRHELSEHSVETKRIVRSTVEDEIIDHEAKVRYDDTMKKINDLEELIASDKRTLQESSRTLNTNIKSLIVSTKKIEGLSLSFQILDPLMLIDKKINEVKDVGHIELYLMLRNAMKIMLSRPPSTSNAHNIIQFDI